MLKLSAMELEEIRDPSADFDSDIEIDILHKDEDEDAVVLDRAERAAISRDRSLNRSSKVQLLSQDRRNSSLSM